MTERATVHVNARFLAEPVTGLQRWGREVLREIDGMVEEGEIDAARWRFRLWSAEPPRAAPDFRHLEVAVRGPFRSHLWEQATLPRLARGLLVNLKSTAPLLHPCLAVVLHDLQVYATPESYTRPFVAWYRQVLPRVARRARALFTLSQFSAREIERWLGVPAARVTVLLGGAEHLLRVPADPAVLHLHGLRRGSYLLAVSSHNPNKNFATAVEAAGRAAPADFPLAIAGAANPRVFARAPAEMPAGARVTGRVSDSELRALYENAAALIYPSFYEGLGLPPLEAMALGCPVILSNTSSLPEVGGDAVLYCNPADVDDVAARVRQVVEDPGLRAELAGKGRAQAARFTWRACARKLWRQLAPLAESCAAGHPYGEPQPT